MESLPDKFGDFLFLVEGLCDFFRLCCARGLDTEVSLKTLSVRDNRKMSGVFVPSFLLFFCFFFSGVCFVFCLGDNSTLSRCRRELVRTFGLCNKENMCTYFDIGEIMVGRFDGMK